MPARAAINLLPKSEFEVSFWGKFLKWALTAGRYIIILTEMVVILAFLSRFKLDSDLSNLSDRIEGKRQILEAMNSSEQQFRAVQTKLVSTKFFVSKQLDMKSMFDKLDLSLPSGGDLKISSVTMSTNQATLIGETANENALGKLLANLSSDSMWNTVELSNVSTKIGNKTTFSIDLTF